MKKKPKTYTKAEKLECDWTDKKKLFSSVYDVKISF